MTIRTLPAPCWVIVDAAGQGREYDPHFDTETKASQYIDPPLRVVRLDKPCAVAECNECDQAVDNDEFSVAHWPDADVKMAADMAREMDFAVAGADAWCERCRIKPHAHVGDDVDDCKRCGNPGEEHALDLVEAGGRDA